MKKNKLANINNTMPPPPAIVGEWEDVAGRAGQWWIEENAWGDGDDETEWLIGMRGVGHGEEGSFSWARTRGDVAIFTPLAGDGKITVETIPNDRIRIRGTSGQSATLRRIAGGRSDPVASDMEVGDWADSDSDDAEIVTRVEGGLRYGGEHYRLLYNLRTGDRQSTFWCKEEQGVIRVDTAPGCPDEREIFRICQPDEVVGSVIGCGFFRHRRSTGDSSTDTPSRGDAS
jgi:hypothetical protein